MITYIIIASNRVDDLNDCLRSICNQTVKFDKIIVVSWGSTLERLQVKNTITQYNNENIKIELVDQENEETIASNRNLGIKYIKDNSPKPEIVVFMDDDTVLDKHWNEKMRDHFMEDIYALQATATMWRGNNLKIQSCGHYLEGYRTLDLGYDQDVKIKNQLRNPPFPCANGAFISWKVIENIEENINDENEEVWDNRFGKLVCFDFGLKAFLLGHRCKLVYDALAYHTGYLATAKGLTQEQVINELIDRQLLYYKFFPEDLRKQAIKILEGKVKKEWWYFGYPHARSIKGEVLSMLYNYAKDSVDKNARKINPIWRDKVAKLSQYDKEKLLGY